MRELIFSEKFALIALNEEANISMGYNKKILLKCIAAACIVELYLDNSFVFDEGFLSVTEEDLKQQSITKYQKIVLESILKKRKIINDKFIICIKEVVSLRNKTLKNIENLYISTLNNSNFIEDKCELLKYNSLNKYQEEVMEVYHTKEDIYINLINELRYRTLNDKDISEENIFMIWLLRESGILFNIFTKSELGIVERNIVNVHCINCLAIKTLQVNISKNIKIKIKNLIKNNYSLYI